MVTMEKEGQNSTEYIPNRTALRLLEALMDPASRLMTVTDVCRKAKIDRKTYYNLFKNKNFTDLFRSLSLDIVKHKSAQMANALIREATRGSAQHLKMALEMAGLYTEKKRVNVPEIEGFGERLARAIERVKKLRQEGK